MTDRESSLSLTPGFQTGFRIRAVPSANLSLQPTDSSPISDLESWIELEGSCEFLPDETLCRVTWLVKRSESGTVEEYSGYTCKLKVSGGRASAMLLIDANALDLVGTGTIGVEVAPDFPYCEPSRVEPGPWGYDNKAHVTLSKTKGCKIGTVVTITPHTSGAYQCGALKIELGESDEGEGGGGTGLIHEIVWPDGDRKPRKWRIGCTSVEGPPTFDYREYGEIGTLEFGVTLFHGQPEAADEASVDPVWRRVWQKSQLVTGVPFPKLEAFSVTEGLLFFANSASGKISGFEPGLAVPLWVGAAVRKWGQDKARWHAVGVELEPDGTFSASFALPPGWEHVDDLYGVSCRAITAAEAFAGVIDYDTSVLSPAAGTIDEVPPRSADKGSASFVVLGQPGAGLLTSALGGKDLNDEVIKKANSKKGGTYKWDNSSDGCPATFKHAGETVLESDPDGSTYCCGFTLWVALEVGKAHGLLDGISAKELKSLQSQWFGSTGDDLIDKKQLAAGLKNFGLGKEIQFLRAKKGDFVQLWRTTGSGHSVVFLNWKKKDNKVVGIKYRSSNSGKGICDNEEDFTGHGGTVDPSACYAGRLMAKVTRPPLITAGDFRFFLKSGSSKTYVKHAEIADAAHYGNKIYAEIGNEDDDYAFAQITKYKSHYGLTTIYNGKDRPRPSPSEVTGSKLQVTAAVSGNEGSFVDVQGYDDSHLTHGAGQWTQKSGNLAELLQEYKTRKPSLFAKYFEDRGVELDGDKILVEGVAVGSKTSLQLAYCLWQSGYDTALQEVQIEVLAARIKEFYPSVKGFDVADYYTSEQSIAHLLDLHVNRPAFVKSVAKQGVEAYLAANPTKKDPSKWSAADEAALVEKFLSIRHTYKTTGFPYPMTDSKERATAIKGCSELSTARNSYKDP